MVLHLYKHTFEQEAAERTRQPAGAVTGSQERCVPVQPQQLTPPLLLLLGTAEQALTATAC